MVIRAFSRRSSGSAASVPPSSVDKTAPPPALTETQTLINDGIRLLHYVARSGNLNVDPDIAAGIINAQNNLHSRNWGEEDENRLLRCYDKLATQVWPVTVESIKSVVPNAVNGQIESPRANRTIIWYRRYTVFTLIMLLSVQIYYLFGYGLTQTLLQYTHLPMSSTSVVQAQPESSSSQNDKLYENHLRASYQLLQYWNQVWMLGNDFQLAPTDQLIPPGQEERTIHFATHLIAAQSVLQMLQNYVLPLMYGLLGAFIFVLRSLLQQIRTLTYTASREIGYRLRLTLGCLAGMITGWLLKPDIGTMTLSPMALAFIAGYSIEVLFSALDMIIDNIRKKTPETKDSTPL
ncbi:hypothetical protein [Vibrio gazogenes]|uniref:Uncharacterized protein n=1 Tax=Vibrio gazogenes DSM 21264 = NBRC 103151 TaxID=1123492 RepID=A0A1M5HIB3_VIBGA|nr:hypothetical protein [Vibrio gazogenes]USP13258.1 hypothetical protein MKS89_12685 [Vibrio gazogenes]SHG15703.1 hypothetical protein SAMN02745781_04109 [Vibrio gazogenes DSM 21264] [Vibrio gazogenes DSM 21264 = NBRC 103151]SJN56700.1 hypothetical protein BQ6471_02166 [Vibrio gazogenes]